MKKTKGIVFILIVLLLIMFPLTINATGYQIDPDTYESSGPSQEDVQEMYVFGGSVAGVIQVVGTIVSVGTIMVIGIKYVLASADEKAEYKERLLPYIIGCVLLFGASNVVGMAYKMFIVEDSFIHGTTEWEDAGGRWLKLTCQCGRSKRAYIPNHIDYTCSQCGTKLYDAYDETYIDDNVKEVRELGLDEDGNMIEINEIK